MVLGAKRQGKNFYTWLDTDDTHTLLIGATRSGKSRRLIMPNAPLAVKVVNDDTGDEEWRIKGFKVVTVFDVAQTEGKPLPELARDLEGATVQGERLYSLLKWHHRCR